MPSNSKRHGHTRLTSTVIAAFVLCTIISMVTTNIQAQLVNTGWEKAPSAMAALLGYQPQQHQMVSLALGHQFFVPNEGQWSDATVRYGLHADHWSIAFREGGEIQLILRKAKPEAAGPGIADAWDDSSFGAMNHRKLQSPTQFDQTSVTLTFPGCNAAAKPVGIHPTPTKVNYFVGGKDRESAAGLATYTGIEYPNLYNGIDLFIRGNEADGTLKYEFHVAAGADASQIQMHYQGLCSPLTQSSAGDLRIPTNLGTLTDHAPFAYQGSKKVQATYMLIGEGDACHISLGDGYDPAQPVVIDPEVEWMTYLGGSGTDTGAGVCVDADGNYLLAGATNSSDFTGGNNSYYGGLRDAFVLRLDPSGSLLWMTYLGGSLADDADGIALDSAGNILISGTTNSPDFFRRLNSAYGNYDAFAAKLNSSGSLQWMKYFGGSDTEEGALGMVVDSQDNATFSGQTNSADFAGHANPPHGGVSDAYLLQVDPSGSLRWMIYLGGTGDDSALGLGLDHADNILVCGNTDSTDFVGQINSPFAYEDAIALKVSPSGLVLWMRYIGGQWPDESFGVVADSMDNILIVGGTDSFDFEGHNNHHHGDRDAYALKLNASGALQWMTYVGGSEEDEGHQLGIDRDGNLIATGWTNSKYIDGSLNFYPGGRESGMVYKVSPSGSLKWAWYLGGTGKEECLSMVLYQDDAVITGGTSSTNFGGHDNSYYGGPLDAFAVKLRTSDTPQLTIDASCPDAGPVQVSWTGATPGGSAALIFAHNQGTFTIPHGQPCAGTPLGLGNQKIRVVWQGQSNANGGKTIHANVGAGVCGSFLQLLDLSDCQTSNVAAIQ